MSVLNTSLIDHIELSKIPDYPKWHSYYYNWYWTFLTKLDDQIYQIHHSPRSYLAVRKYNVKNIHKYTHLPIIPAQELWAAYATDTPQLAPLRDQIKRSLPEFLMEIRL